MTSVEERQRHADVAITRFSIWGTSGVLGVTDPDALPDAGDLLDDLLDRIDVAANRFRPDSEISALNAASGLGPITVSRTLLDLVDGALRAARTTQGACDPTIGRSLVALGYDRDFDQVKVSREGSLGAVAPSRGSESVEIDGSSSTITLPYGVQLDLGATAKARAADLAARSISEILGIGAMVDLGGDLSMAGAPPADGWLIGVTPDASTGRLDHIDEVVALTGGGLASSSTTVRTWRRGEHDLHHIVDPKTGWPARSPWSLVSVAAPSCIDANALSTASIVWGDDALYELPQRGVAARLVHHDGTVERVGGWPEPLTMKQSA